MTFWTPEGLKMGTWRINQMHIALCEWMGYAIEPSAPTGWWNLKCNGEFVESFLFDVLKIPGLSDIGKLLPPLTLDWLHECEVKLEDKQFGRYLAELIPNRPIPGLASVEDFCNAFKATKEQRLEALYKTLFPVV